MSCSLAQRLAALAVLASTSFAGSDPQVSVRGYVLEGQLLLYPPAEQDLAAGWSLVSEGHQRLEPVRAERPVGSDARR
jgi:hypothetical protein